MLYKQYSNAKHIKLQTCASCSHDVDPYVERELLLVVMDMMLLRSSAYRHFFFNRYAASRTSTSTSGAGEVEFNLYSLQNSCIGCLVCFVLRTILKLQGVKNGPGSESHFDAEGESRDSDEVQFFLYLTGPLIMQSLIEFSLLWFFIMISSWIYLRVQIHFLNHMKTAKREFLGSANFMKADKKNDSIQAKYNPKVSRQGKILSIPACFWGQMHMAIVVPQLFNIITISVHIYENSSMVRGIGSSIFVPSFGAMAVKTVLERFVFQFRSIDDKGITAQVIGDDQTDKDLNKETPLG